MESLKYITCDEMNKAWELFYKWVELTMNKRGVNAYAWRQSVKNRQREGGNFYKYFPKISVEEGKAKMEEIIKRIRKNGYYGVYYPKK